MNVLVVDDNLTIRRVLVGLLGRHAFCDTAVNGRSAVDAVFQQVRGGLGYDLICLDLSLPDLDGLEALHQIRAVESSHAVAGAKRSRVVVITAHDDADTETRAFDAGCDAFLRKPFDAARVSSLLAELGLVKTGSSRDADDLAQGPALVDEARTVLSQVLGDDARFVDEALGAFAEQASQMFSEVLVHLERGDGDAVRDGALALARVSSDVGSTGVARLCEHLASVAAAGTADGVRPAADRLGRALSHFRKASAQRSA